MAMSEDTNAALPKVTSPNHIPLTSHQTRQHDHLAVDGVPSAPSAADRSETMPEPPANNPEASHKPSMVAAEGLVPIISTGDKSSLMFLINSFRPVENSPKIDLSLCDDEALCSYVEERLGSRMHHLVREMARLRLDQAKVTEEWAQLASQNSSRLLKATRAAETVRSDVRSLLDRLAELDRGLLSLFKEQTEFHETGERDVKEMQMWNALHANGTVKLFQKFMDLPVLIRVCVAAERPDDAIQLLNHGETIVEVLEMRLRSSIERPPKLQQFTAAYRRTLAHHREVILEFLAQQLKQPLLLRDTVTVTGHLLQLLGKMDEVMTVFLHHRLDYTREQEEELRRVSESSPLPALRRALEITRTTVVTTVSVFIALFPDRRVDAERAAARHVDWLICFIRETFNGINTTMSNVDEACQLVVDLGEVYREAQQLSETHLTELGLAFFEEIREYFSSWLCRQFAEHLQRAQNDFESALKSHQWSVPSVVDHEKHAKAEMELSSVFLLLDARPIGCLNKSLFKSLSVFRPLALPETMQTVARGVAATLAAAISLLETAGVKSGHLDAHNCRLVVRGGFGDALTLFHDVLIPVVRLALAEFYELKSDAPRLDEAFQQLPLLQRLREMQPALVPVAVTLTDNHRRTSLIGAVAATG